MNHELAERPLTYTVDAVILTPHQGQLALVLKEPLEGETTWSVPWAFPAQSDTLNDAASGLVELIVGSRAAWIEQVGAFGDGFLHPAQSPLSVAFTAILPLGTLDPDDPGYKWVSINSLPPLYRRQELIVETSLEAVRDRMDLSPIAFKLLPASFTLSELQTMYELLLGKRLHKASFRRALQAAWLVEPTDEWRSEGRGRPAQLYRYSPKKRRKGRRGVRFDLLS